MISGAVLVGFAGTDPQHLHCTADRRQWVSQLVGQGGEEFVFAAIGFLEAVFHLPPIGNVGGERRDPCAPDKPNFEPRSNGV